MNYKFYSPDDEPKEYEHLTEYRDGNGNILTIYEVNDEDFYPAHPEVQSFLDEFGYDGDGNWELS